MNTANSLSLLRILLVPVFLTTLMYYTPSREYLGSLAVILFALACLTDALDGFIARKYNQKTLLGSYLDPIADKMLLLAGFLALSFMHHLPFLMKIPMWVTIPVLTRDAVILIGSAVIFLVTGKLIPEPLFVGKLTTVSQMLTLFLALMSVDPLTQMILHGVTVCLTLFSGLLYIQMGGRLAQP